MSLVIVMFAPYDLTLEVSDGGEPVESTGRTLVCLHASLSRFLEIAPVRPLTPKAGDRSATSVPGQGQRSTGWVRRLLRGA